MVMARYSGVVQDQAGNIITNAKIEVRRETPGAPLAAPKEDRDGLVNLGNPFNANADGTFAFHVVGGAYKVRAYVGASGAPTFEYVKRFVANGTAAEHDAEDFVATGTVRERLTANRTYYVAPSGSGGSDSNDGMTDLKPFLTSQKAIDLIIKTLDLAGFTVTIQLADGTYTGSSAFNFSWTGGGAIVIQGNSSTPGNVIIGTTSANCFSNNGVLPGILTVKDMELRTTTSGSGISNSGVGSIQFQNVNFGACATAHLVTNAKSSKIQAVGNYAINGSSGFHMLSLRGEIEISARTVTLTGTPAFGTAFAYASREGYIGAEANTFSGSATGPRYAVSSNAVIYTGGGGVNYFPGNSAGSGTNAGVSPYGLYI